MNCRIFIRNGGSNPWLFTIQTYLIHDFSTGGRDSLSAEPKRNDLQSTRKGRGTCLRNFRYGEHYLSKRKRPTNNANLVWMLLSALSRFGSGYPQISQRKPIIRTRLLSEKGSDYRGLVRPRGLEPRPVSGMEPKSIVSANFTMGASVQGRRVN